MFAIPQILAIFSSHTCVSSLLRFLSASSPWAQWLVLSCSQNFQLCVSSISFSFTKQGLCQLTKLFQRSTIQSNPEDTRAVVRKFIRTLAARDFTELLTMGAPNATFFFAGLTSKIPMAGTASYQERLGHQLPQLFANFATLTNEELGITVEGETGVAEIHIIGMGAAGTPQEGKTYDNHSLMKFVVKDGKIESIREYIDFFAIFDYLGS